MNRIMRLICWLRGHDDLYRFIINNRWVRLECQRCGRLTEGWGRIKVA